MKKHQKQKQVGIQNLNRVYKEMIKSTESNRSILYNLIKLNNIEGDENFVDLKNADMSPLRKI